MIKMRMFGAAAIAAAAVMLVPGCMMPGAQDGAVKRVGPVKVACVGDSLTSGFNMQNPEEGKYPAQLGKLAGDGVEVKAFAVPGRTALRAAELSLWKEGALKEALEWSPDFVVLCLGANDCWPEIWEKHSGEFRGDLADMVEEFKKLPSAPKVWLATPTPMFIPDDKFPGNVQLKILGGEVVPQVAEVAKSTGSGLIDFYGEMRGRRELFLIDRVHPTPEGAGKMAGIVWKAVSGDVKAAK